MAKSTKNTAAQALMDLDEMQAKFKEASKSTIKALLQEAVKDELNNAIDDDEEEKDDAEEYTISDSAESEPEAQEEEDNEKPEDEESEVEDSEEDSEDEQSEDENEEDSEEDDKSEGDEWSEFDKYKDEDGDYDFSGENGEEAEKAIAKVYKLLQDTDEIIVKKDGEKVDVKIPETGAEYVVDFGEENPEVEKADDSEELNEMEDPMLDSEEEGTENEYEEPMDDELEESEEDEDDSVYGDEEEFDDEFESEPEDELGRYDDADEFMAENKNKKARKTMKENKNQVLFEVDLGYTDDYQKKDPIEGLSASEPAKGKDDWDAGVPKGTKKPWAGKGKSAPFEKQVNEEEMSVDADSEMPEEMPVEDANLEEGGIGHKGKVVARSTAKTQMKDKGAKVTHHNSKNGKYEGDINENVNAKLEQVLAQNKVLKEATLALKKNLQEALLVNVNLGQIVRLLQENATTKAEKLDIINRFDAVKSFNESKSLYESISRELSSSKKNITLEEKQMTAAPTKINESKVYENPALSEIRNMMSRMDTYNK